MYAHISGTLSYKGDDSLVIDCNGVGYLLACSKNTLSAAPKLGRQMKCYTLLSVREDALDLFGFATREEKALYEKLRTVSGIGPRTALAILSTLSVHDLSLAIVTGDITSISRAPGVGKKTAQRIVLELKEKIDDTELTAQGLSISTVPAGSAQGEAIDALTALGYSAAEAATAISRLSADNSASVDQLVFMALKGMGG